MKAQSDRESESQVGPARRERRMEGYDGMWGGRKEERVMDHINTCV